MRKSWVNQKGNVGGAAKNSQEQPGADMDGETPPFSANLRCFFLTFA
jgi:hypothetical protein